MAPRAVDRLMLALVLLSALLVRLPFLTTDPQITTDIATFVRWARTASDVGVASVYEHRDVNYGPVSIFLLAGAAWIEAHLPATLRDGDRAMVALIKLPSIVADVLTAGLIAWALRRRMPQRPKLALLGALGYAFNPGVWYVSAYWGQMDSIYTLFMVVTVLALAGGAVRSAWVAYVLVMTIKIVGVSLAPLVLVWSLARHGLRASLAGLAAAIAAGVVLLAPWLIAGRLHEVVLRAYLGWTPQPPRIVVSGYNLWYLLLGGHVHNVSSLLRPDGLPLSYLGISLVLLAIFTVVILILATRWNRDPVLAGGALTLGTFMLLTQMHERHMLPALPFVLLAAAGYSHKRLDLHHRWLALLLSRPGWWDYAVLSLTFFFNLVTIASFAPAFVTNLVAADAVTTRLHLLKGAALVAAALNTIVLVRLTVAIATDRTWTNEEPKDRA